MAFKGLERILALTKPNAKEFAIQIAEPDLIIIEEELWNVGNEMRTFIKKCEKKWGQHEK